MRRGALRVRHHVRDGHVREPLDAVRQVHLQPARGAGGQRRDEHLVVLRRVPGLVHGRDRILVAHLALHGETPRAHRRKRGGQPLLGGLAADSPAGRRGHQQGERAARAARPLLERGDQLWGVRGHVGYNQNPELPGHPLSFGRFCSGRAYAREARPATRRGSWAARARGPGSARAAPSPRPAPRAARSRARPPRAPGDPRGRPATRFWIRFRIWSAKCGVEAPMSWRTSSTVGSRTARSGRSYSLMGGRLSPHRRAIRARWPGPGSAR